MKLKRVFLTVLLVLSLISILVLSGCTSPQRRPAPAPAPTPNVTPGPGPAQSEEIPDFRGMDPGPIEGKNQNQNGSQNGAQEAQRLATMINVLPEVNSSSVILTGNTAVIGLDLKANLNTQRIDSIKAEVTRKIKRANNRITNVTFTADNKQ